MFVNNKYKIYVILSHNISFFIKKKKTLNYNYNIAVFKF